jgi:cyanophycin synthetase
VKRGFYHGYDFGLTQPSMVVSARLPLEILSVSAYLEAWLTDHFLIDPQGLAAVRTTPQADLKTLARRLIHGGLLIYGELARASYLPCFDGGRLIEFEPASEDAGVLVAKVALPVTDNVPRKIFVKLFSEALGAVRTASCNPPRGDLVRELFTKLDRGIAENQAQSPFRGNSTVTVCRIAHRHDLPFRHVGHGFVRLGTGCKAQLLHSSAPQRDSSIGAMICQDKSATARVLLAAGLPGAEHILVTSHQAARTAAQRLGWPVVVKPADRERSEGVTVGITEESALLGAYDKARAISRKILVERHVAGTCHRIYVAAGKVLYAVKRIPKRVRGNGRDSVATLIEAANARQAALPPWKRLKPFPADSDAVECLAADGFTLASVPPEGQFAYLRPLAAPEWGGEIEDLTRQIHPENAELATVAARLLGLTVAGVDFITTDIAQPWHVNGAIINEMNFNPQFAIAAREIDERSMIEALMDGDGRIPVHLITGSGDLTTAARQLKLQLSDAGRSCHSTSSTYTEGPDGIGIYLAASTLFERSLALAMRPEVQEMILVGPPQQLFEKGLAVDRLESIQVIEANARKADRLLRKLQTRFSARSAVTSAV